MIQSERSFSDRLRTTLCALAFALAGLAAWAAGPSVEPVFPPENQNLLFIEGEDAVATNFAREPTLNFGTSGYRALQLNQSAGIEGIGSFYADYVFTVPSAGAWELWYGGTPPGPRDELYASYASPLVITIDSQKPLPRYREDVAVVENYSPAYYWNRVSDVTLDAGRHTLRFEVTEKRRFDGRYYFYLDCFFLVRKEGGKRVLSGPVPPVFPRDMEDRRIDTPYLSIDDYLIRVRDAAGRTQPLVEISLVYSLLGDYLNALKYLNKAALIQPQDPVIALLIAKNRIWKGDLADGLRKYRELLTADPKRREVWLEAGKVAAWSGRYDDSIGFFKDGLAAFPEDADLMINLGLTYIWAGRGPQAETVFHQAQALAGTDAGKLKDIGRVYKVNGYPDRAVRAYAAAAAADPRDLESRLLLIDTLQAMGKKAEAAAALKQIADTFVSSPRLAAYLESYKERAGLKDAVLEEYRKKLEENPDNLVLRQLLAQAYFWNGLKGNAIEEYRHILDNHAYKAVRDAESASARLLWSIDRSLLLKDWFSRLPQTAKAARAALAAQAQKLAQARSARGAAAASLEKAKTAQAEEALATAEGAVGREEAALSARAAEAQALLGQFQSRKIEAASVGDMAAELRQADTAAEDAFARATAGSKWKFDRSGTLAELAKDAGNNALARLVSARIYLMDGQFAPALSLLQGGKPGGGADVETQFTIARSLLLSGKVKEASAIIARLSSTPSPAALPSYFGDLAALAAALSGTAAVEGDAAPTAAGAAADAEAAARDLAGLDAGAAAERDLCAKDIAQLATLYRHALVRALYAFDERVFSIRNELGDYYLADDPPRLDEAIVQFNMVLAVDPGDLSATFRLGKVYQWKGDWKSALDSYRAVYAADPYFENVVSLYNQVAREHADTLGSLGWYLADTQRVWWHAETLFTSSINSTFGLAAMYQTDSVRIERDDTTGTGHTDHSAYQLHDLSVGVPVKLLNGRLDITPWIGGVMGANGLFEKTDSGGSAVVNDDRFGVYAVEPYAKLDASFGGWSAVFLNATMRWGRQPDTWDLLRTPVYDASAEANAFTNLSFIDVWPFKDTSLRTYGRVDYLHTAALAYENFLYTALQEITVNVLKGGKPYGVLSLNGKVTWQQSQKDEMYLYYAPLNVLQAGGGLTGSMSFGVGGGDVLGLSLRAYAGTYQERVSLPNQTHRIQAEAEADASLTQGSGTWTLAVTGNATYNLDPSVNPWDYSSVTVRFGYTTKLARLLAP